MDPLKEVPSSQWPALRELYRADWPDEIEGFCSLDTQISVPSIAESFNIKVYCPEGNIHNGMIIVSDLEEKRQICICPVNKDLTLLEKALLNTSVIDWKKEFSVASVKPYIQECIQRICKQLGVTVTIYGGFFKYIFQDSMPFENVCCPPNTYVGPLKSEHLALVDKTWTYHSKTSHMFFKKLMKNDFSYVLYSDDHQPVAWVHVDQFGFLAHLYCLEEHRRKGYAEYITKVALNDIRRKGRYVLTYSLNDNYKSQKLFTKLKFEPLGQVAWIYLSKENNQN